MARKRDKIAFLKACIKARNNLARMQKVKPAVMKRKLELAARSVITLWYTSYNPRRRFYNSQEGLYHAYKIEQDGIDVSISFDSSYIEEAGFSYHQKTEIIYQNAFIEGYHGGSGTKDDPNNLRWRTPPYPDKNTGIAPWSRWSERTVARSNSPWKKISKKAYKMLNEYDEEWDEEFNEDVLVPLQRALARLQKG